MATVVTLALLGDLMLGRTVSDLVRTKPPAWIWGDVGPILRRADAVLANLECPITSSGDAWHKTWKMFHFRAVPETVDILRAGNIGFVSLANNHILDFGEGGLRDTIRHLDAAGIRHGGAGRNAADAAAPVLVDAGPLRVGIVAATDAMRPFRSGPRSPGTNYIAIGPDSPGLESIRGSADQARRSGAALVVLSLHWGPNMRLRPRAHFRTFARAAIDAGIDIVHGHSAHVFQGVERYVGGLILYDTGNFIDDHWNFWNFGGYWNFPFRHDDWSFVFLVEVEDARLLRLRMVPVRTRPWPLGVATGDTARSITSRMSRLCDKLGTRVNETAEAVEIDLRS